MDMHVNFILASVTEDCIYLSRCALRDSFSLFLTPSFYISVTLCTIFGLVFSPVSTDLINRIQSMLKRLFKFGYATSLISFQDLVFNF